MCSLILCFVVLLCGGACSSGEEMVAINKTPIVTAVEGSQAMVVAQSYCQAEGYEFLSSATLTDCAVTVENGKFDFMICSEYDAVNLSKFDLKLAGKCDYKMKLGLCFSAKSTELQQGFNSAIKALQNNGTLRLITDSYKGNGEFENPVTTGAPIYIVCTDGFDGYVTMDSEGVFRGLEIDIVTAVCNYLGYTPVFTGADYDECFGKLYSGEADLMMSVDLVDSALSDEFILSDSYLEVAYNIYSSQIE